MIDDNPTVLAVNFAMLKKTNALTPDDQFDAYKNPTDFFAVTKENNVNYYDVIIVDYDLGPDNMKGLEIISGMIKQGFTGKAVLLTGNDSAGLGMKMMMLPNIDYAIKNISTGEKSTIAILAKAIERARF